MSFSPVFKSPISKPSSSLTFTKQRVCGPLTVNGRMLAANGPTVRTIWCVRVSTTVRFGEFKPAR